MSNLNIKATANNTYDAIVVGSGISGGWAAKELTEKGLKVLLLERGRNVEHVKDYTTAMKKPWEFEHRGKITEAQKETHPIQKRDYPYTEFNESFWVDDTECPYTEVKRFDWYRGFHVGGKSLMWGRQSYRFSDLNFEDNLKDGHGVDWPIRYKDIAPWYDYVEKFAGISGKAENWPALPDGEFLPPMEMNCVEKDVKKRIEDKWKKSRIMTIGRVANLTVEHGGRAKCQYRNLCSRGCPFGAYFSTQSSTLPAAVATGNLTLRPFSLVNTIIYDKETQKAKGVVVIDSETKETIEYFAKIVFVNGSTLGSTFLLLNSVSDEHPNGLGNGSGELGHNLMDHHFRCGASGRAEGFDDKYTFGKRANGIYIPRYQNMNGEKRDYVRGFGYQGGASRGNWHADVAELAFGAEFKDQMTVPGAWNMGLGGFGESLPYHENRVYIDKSKKDKWGQPVLAIDCEFKENEQKMRVDMMNDAAEMLEAAGMKDVNTYDNGSAPGMAIHEMGTARMGHDPKTSVLNKWNQMHEVKNVFVTDGSCMTSAACQNPSLTYMALTARACDFAVSELKKGNI
ncbi:GMC oxidoreductase [Pedobacter psychroterrae]|uniref:GMC family oxidoreductase n=1 Tax=Pedobacter psychroterrae TaxID=2530453 RepID=A0A4R0NRJ1_9SPHI|nr:GMC family oxidoreductase [Pedobacter psychroterrae]TCD02463.1 GMC family oxidoreductase [Pedobacter psychroterrae]